MKDFGSQQFPPLPDKLRCPQTSAFEDGNRPQVLHCFLQVTGGYKGGIVKVMKYNLGMKLLVKRRILRSPGNMQQTIFKKLA